MSVYPDNSQPYVLLPLRDPPKTSLHAKITREDAKAIVCHRKTQAGVEEYLVQWRTTNPRCIPYSWHDLNDLTDNLFRVQKYLDTFYQNFSSNGRKRKSPENDTASDVSSSRSSSSPAPRSYDLVDIQVYNGRLTTRNGRIRITPLLHATHVELPTPLMLHRARMSLTRHAEQRIRQRFQHDLSKLQGPLVEIVNRVDYSSPPINFLFINESEPFGKVTITDSEIIVGCGGKGGCRPHMGQNMGCEYSKLCSCLEFAQLDTFRMTPRDHAQHAQGDLMGLPKRFPYFSPAGNNGGCLVPFYLEARYPIYECNLRCECGPGCKTRVVQKGRQIPLEIFKTTNRGWGLRCPVNIQKGQFIDTYRGEIITNEEATHREDCAGKIDKQSYLYSLDKHVGDLDGEGKELTAEDCYVVDGQYKGGPTRFINHSCDPNCRQYTVSYNKYDIKIYELAFFACENIPAGTELTFNYKDTDRDEDNDNEEQGDVEDYEIECRCGSANCVGKLWA